MVRNRRTAPGHLRSAAALGLALTLAVVLARLPGAAAQGAVLQGRPVRTTASRTDSLRAMAQRDLAAGFRAGVRPGVRRGVAHPFRPAPIPEGDGGTETFFSSGQVLPGRDAPQTNGGDFDGVSIQDEPGVNAGFENIPPDTDGCVGPSHFVEMVNGAVAIFNKLNGGRLSLVSLDSFFFVSATIPGSPNAGPKATDPHIIYDRRSGHWIATVIDVLNTDNNCILAISRTPDPTGVWDKYAFDAGTGGVFADYDTLGIDDNGIYIGFNNFGSTFATKVWATPKSAAIAAQGAAITITDLNPAGFADMSTPQPAYNFDAVSASGPAWVIGNFSFSAFSLRKITWTGASPSISNAPMVVPVAAQLQPVAPPVPNSVSSPDGGDIRLLASIVRSGSLWTAHTVGANSSGSSSAPVDRDAAAWYQINVSGASPALTQQGRVFDGSAANPKSFYYPTLCVSGQGHAAMAFSGSSTADFIGVYTCGRLASDASGTMQSVLQIKAGLGDYDITFGGAKNRWGDYSYTSLDPVDDQTLWTIQEYAKAPTAQPANDNTSVWATRIARLVAPAPTLSNPNGSGTQGQTGATLNLTGTGLFDPGTGFTRPTAVLSGNGISNYSLTVNSATTATLTFDIAGGAATGTRNLTFTNPDGQLVTVNNAFTVNGGAVFNLSSATYSIGETGGTLSVPVNRTINTSGAATVNYHTTNVTATSGSDYTGTNAGVASFNDGDASAVIAIPVADDALVEGSETFTVTLDSASTGSLGATTTATVTITDDQATPKPTIGSASVTAPARVTLSITDHCANEDDLRLERALKGSGFSEIATLSAKSGTGTTFSFADTGVTATKSYSYRVRARKGANYSSYSSVVDITVNLPTAPTLTSVTVLSARQVNLHWQDNSLNEQNFRIDAMPSGGSFSPLVTLAPGATAASPGGLDPDTDYTFRVVAVNGAGESASGTLLAHTFATPAPPTRLTASPFSSSQIRLVWNSGGAHTDFYQLERNTDGTSFSKIAAMAKTVTAFTDGGLAQGTTYTYQVRSISGTSLASASLFALGAPSAPAAAAPLSPPTPPTNLQASGISATQIQLTWQDGGTNTDRFRVERQNGASWTLLATLNKTVLTYTDSGLQINHSFTYRVSAIAGTDLTDPNHFLVSAPAGPVTTSTLAAPAAPTGLTATAQAGKKIQLAWVDHATTETGYRVERSTDGTSFGEIAQPAANATSFQDTGLTAGQQYFYRVRAVSGGAFSAYSNTKSATALP